LGLDGVQGLELAQGFRRHRMTAGGVEVEELASGMGQAGQPGDAQSEEGVGRLVRQETVGE